MIFGVNAVIDSAQDITLRAGFGNSGREGDSGGGSISIPLGTPVGTDYGFGTVGGSGGDGGDGGSVIINAELLAVNDINLNGWVRRSGWLWG